MRIGADSITCGLIGGDLPGEPRSHYSIGTPAPQGPPVSGGEATCPQCGSTSIQAVPIPRKQVGNAVIAEYFLGTAAGVAAGTSTVIQAVCLKCGCQWFPGTAQESRIRALSGQFGEPARRAELERLDHQKRRKASVTKALAFVTKALAFVGMGAFLAALAWAFIGDLQQERADRQREVQLVDSTTQAWSALQSHSAQGKDVTLFAWHQYSIHAVRGMVFLQRNGCGSTQASCSSSMCSHVTLSLADAVSLRYDGIPVDADKRLASGWSCDKERN